jgi:hypothetical protein
MHRSRAGVAFNDPIQEVLQQSGEDFNRSAQKKVQTISFSSARILFV